MRFVALVSGGKDSCYNAMCAVADGHELICMANLQPPTGRDELDSYMYQTVGHEGIDLYAEAAGLPLYRRTISGTPIALASDYELTKADEVEDLFELLRNVKSVERIEAVSVGAIFSDYQRVRVENVCQRLNLKMLAYLWHKEQSQLLKKMINSGLKAVIIKVAALGLNPQKHIGMLLNDIYPELLDLKEKYGINVCGEGGEFETFVLDCPLFKKQIVIEDSEIVIHSNDAFAPVGYLKLKRLSLQEKPGATPNIKLALQSSLKLSELI